MCSRPCARRGSSACGSTARFLISTRWASWPRARITRIEAVVDRIVVREGVDARLADSTRLAISHGEGTVLAVYIEPVRRWRAARRPTRLAGAAVQHALRLSALQDQLRGARAAHVQLQQPVRSLPDVRRAGLARAVRSRRWSCRTIACRWPTGRWLPGKGPRRPNCAAQDAARALAASRRHSIGTRRWPTLKPRFRETIVARRRPQLPRRAHPARAAIRHLAQAGRARAARGVSRRRHLQRLRRCAAASRSPSLPVPWYRRSTSWRR